MSQEDTSSQKEPEEPIPPSEEKSKEEPEVQQEEEPEVPQEEPEVTVKIKERKLRTLY